MNDRPGRLESTLDLVELTRRGDRRACQRLIARYQPLLTRWAHGKLPNRARDLSETSDLVQATLMRAFQTLPNFEVQGPGAFFGYLRQILSNLVRDELRRVQRRPAMDELDERTGDPDQSPLSSAVSAESMARYERALQSLPAEQRDIVIMRVELGLDYQEIVDLTDSPSANAARMRVARALAELAKQMRPSGTDGDEPA